MSVAPFLDVSHNLDGEIDLPDGHKSHKSGIEPWRLWSKYDFLPPLWASYTMPEALLKMDHPSFFELSRADGDFRPRGGLSCLFRFADTFAGLRDDFFVFQTTGMHHCNTPGPESSAGICKT